MKIFGWGTNPDWAILVQPGGKGRFRWSVLKHGETKFLSPVRGWDTEDEARADALECLNGIGADHLAMQETDNG